MICNVHLDYGKMSVKLKWTKYFFLPPYIVRQTRTKIVSLNRQKIRRFDGFFLSRVLQLNPTPFCKKLISRNFGKTFARKISKLFQVV